MLNKIAFDPQKCTGCMACILSCSVKKNDVYSYRLAHLRMQRDEATALSSLRFCGNCANFDCIDACPVAAIAFNPTYQIPLLGQAVCVQCKLCVTACPAGLVKEKADGSIVKCDFCAGDPACVKACIPQALTLKAADNGDYGEVIK